MTYTYIILYPDNARPSAVWGVKELEVTAFYSAIYSALGTSPNAFDKWIEEWRDNFHSNGGAGVAQRWGSSFDPHQWITSGELLCSAIEAVTNYRVVRAFKTYARNPREAN